ncbi:uncharacterized protein ACOB8E_017697 [Sarcophilus harrisii]
MPRKLSPPAARWHCRLRARKETGQGSGGSPQREPGRGAAGQQQGPERSGGSQRGEPAPDELPTCGRREGARRRSSWCGAARRRYPASPPLRVCSPPVPGRETRSEPEAASAAAAAAAAADGGRPVAAGSWASSSRGGQSGTSLGELEKQQPRIPSLCVRLELRHKNLRCSQE